MPARDRIRYGGITVTVHSIATVSACQSSDMARPARVVVPGLPHHATRRGKGRARTLFSDDVCALHRDLLATHCHAAQVGVWAWCLMPNHVLTCPISSHQG
ncbi:MAG: hypothetical protein BroJett029_20380 [Alphaproteobacteria bacterium]|nr:MAG: hypothetical protein BroJett029_20380 [Alphaproteobacteria bacterium]